MEAYRPIFAHLFPCTDIDVLTHAQWLSYKAFADDWREMRASGGGF